MSSKLIEAKTNLYELILTNLDVIWSINNFLYFDLEIISLRQNFSKRF